MSTLPKSINISDVFVGMFGVAGFLALLVYYGKRFYSRLNCVKRRRILPTVLDDVEDNEIEIPRVVDATEIAYSDDEDAFLEEIPSASILNISNLRRTPLLRSAKREEFEDSPESFRRELVGRIQTHFAIAKESVNSRIYVEAYRNNEVSKPVIVELPAKLIQSDEELQSIAVAVAKQIV